MLEGSLAERSALSGSAEILSARDAFYYLSDF